MTARRWTPKRAIAQSRRNIEGASERLRAVANIWADIDESICRNADRLVDDLTAFADEIETDTLARIAAGEHVGL